MVVTCFNSRSRVGSDAPESAGRSTNSCFNSRSRVGSDALHRRAHEVHAVVSIHAPAWGATRITRRGIRKQRFQFTLPRGERLADNRNLRDELYVSIHAPAWGATALAAGEGDDRKSFNSRSRVGSDTSGRSDTAKPSKFQFTLPRGERQGARRARTSRNRFQFTLPRGERQAFAQCGGGLAPVSIHAPAWGATGSEVLGPREGPVSIHAPAWGATSNLWFDRLFGLFQFTLPRGERPVIAAGRAAAREVSIHAPAWGATGRE